jgi:hypothetical protein
MPMIDPAEFSDAGLSDNRAPGALGDTPIDDSNLDDPELHPPGSPGWARRQAEIKRPPSADSMDDEDRFRAADRRARAKIAENNRLMHEQAELHQQELMRVAATAQVDLKTLLDILGEPMAMRIRMEAYLRALDRGHGNARERQLDADTLSLRIARYCVEGRAE